MTKRKVYLKPEGEEFTAMAQHRVALGIALGYDKGELPDGADWRRFYSVTQQELAKALDVSVRKIKMIHAAKRRASPRLRSILNGEEKHPFIKLTNAYRLKRIARFTHEVQDAILDAKDPKFMLIFLEREAGIRKSKAPIN
jgi:hypothetical protein